MQALALKYRPKSFYELIGQDAIKENLISALDSGRLGHAYLFSGLRGSGKTSSARIFAKDLLCEKGIGSHACEVCENCVAANEGRHIDIIEMDAASHRKIEDIRDLIEQTRYAPISGRFKIFIIDEAHMLTKEASNAFLKTLEEPPAYIKFILATTDPLKLPATILSRTQHFRFKAINTELIVKHLEEILAKEGIAFETPALSIITRCGQGSLRDTLTLLDQAIIFCGGNISAAAVSDMLGLLDPAKIEEILSVVTRGANDELCALIKSLETNDAEMVINEIIASLKEKFIQPMPEFSLFIFEKFFRILSDAKNMLGGGADPAFTLYVTLFAMRECFNVGTPNSQIPQNIIAQNFTAQNAQNSRIPEPRIPEPQVSQMPQNAQNTQNSRIPEPNSEPQVSQSAQNSRIAENSQNSRIPESQAPQNTQNSSFESFINLLYDRDYNLGEVFKKYIEFAGFDGNNLSLISSVVGDDAMMLRSHSSVIRELAKKAFGECQIKIEKKKAKTALELANSVLGADFEAPKIEAQIEAQPEPPKEPKAPNKELENRAKIAEIENLFNCKPTIE